MGESLVKESVDQCKASCDSAEKCISFQRAKDDEKSCIVFENNAKTLDAKDASNKDAKDGKSDKAENGEKGETKDDGTNKAGDNGDNKDKAKEKEAQSFAQSGDEDKANENYTCFYKMEEDKTAIKGGEMKGEEKMKGDEWKMKEPHEKMEKKTIQQSKMTMEIAGSVEDVKQMVE